MLLIKAIRINTLPKLTYTDLTKFISLIEDVFPSVESSDIDYKELTKAIEEVLVAMKLHKIDTQILKIL